MVLKGLHNIKKFRLKITSKNVANIKELIQISRLSSEISGNVDKVIDTSIVSTFLHSRIFG